MKKKITIILVMSLLLGTAASSIQRVRAQTIGKLYIKPDGTIDPPSVGLARDGDLYYFYTHIWDYEIIVQKPDIVIDGNGYELRGPGKSEPYYGFWVEASNVTIENTYIRDWYFGIWVNPNGEYSSSDNHIHSNRMADVTRGINIDRSSGNTIYWNNIFSNSEYYNAIGIMIYSGAFVPPVVPSCHNNIYENNITSNSWGVYVDEYSEFNIISGNNVSDNTYGISLGSCSNNSVSDNVLWPNDHGFGIELDGASYNVISRNIITRETLGGECGIVLDDSHYNTIVGLGMEEWGIVGIEVGIGLRYGASNNDISDYMLLTRFGVYLIDACNDNKFYHNNFYLSITEHVHDDSWDDPGIAPSVNTWDNGYPSGGNRWRGHSTVDKYHGLDQDQLGGDGIADIPYVIDENNEDRYPLTLTSAYGARIKAVSDLSPAHVDITKDGVPTGYTTEHYFGDLKGTHWFTVPDRDPLGHPFKEWNTGETNTTIPVTSAGTYTAYYEAGVIDMAFGSTPTVDGIISAGEYLDANSVTFATSGGTCTVYFKHDGATLYVAFDVPNVDAYSAVQVFADTEYDQANAPQTDDYQFTITIMGELWERQGSGTDWHPPSPPEDWTGAHQVFETIWSAEFAIAYEKLGITAGVPKTIGMSFWNAWTLTGDHHWPTTIADWLNPSTWGVASSHNNWTLPNYCTWTCLAYLDADIDLEFFEVNQFLEMATVGSTPDVNIVVQMDRQGFGGLWDDWRYDDWTGCKRYLVTYNMTPTIANALQTLGEVNMGDPNTLANFVAWGIQNYPADHYIVVLLDHGGGWKGVCIDGTNDFDLLTPTDLKQALATVENAVGRKIDIVGFDACLMGMIEIAYQIKDHADIMVASEEVEPANLPGCWPYDYILGNLTSIPMMTPSELASQIVTSYIDSYSNSPHSYANKTTMSAVNLGLMAPTIEDLAIVTSNFAQELIDALPNHRNEITQARLQTEEYYYPTYIDLYHFAQLVHTLVSDSDIQTAAEQVMNTLTDTVIAEEHGWEHPNSHGLSIYFPQNAEDYNSAYENLTFATDTTWDEFVHAFVYVETPVQVDGETYTITTQSNVTLTDVTANKANLSFTASVTSGQTGYVNITMPVELNQTEIEVFIDGEPVTPPFPIITTNGTHYFIYFEFTLSTHDITIRYAITDIAVTNVTSSKTVVGQGYCMNLTVTVENLGNYTETFNVTAYYNSNIINHTTVTNLPPGEETTITLTWNTTGVAKGNYTIKAIADPVLGETDTTDNTFTDGTVKVTIPGDVNGDDIVDGMDLGELGMSWLAGVGDPNYVANRDINCDGTVDGMDLGIMGMHWLQTNP